MFIALKFIRKQEIGLIFQEFPGGACPRPPTPLASLHACGACLLRACGACPFAAAPLMKYALTTDPTNQKWLPPGLQCNIYSKGPNTQNAKSVANYQATR